MEIDSLFDGIDFDCTVTRQQFNELNQGNLHMLRLVSFYPLLSSPLSSRPLNLYVDLFAACLVPVDQALQDANIEKTKIDEVVLIGGSTRIVEVQRMLEEYFSGKQLVSETER